MKKLGEIAEIIGGNLDGDPKCIIKGFAGIEEAKEGDITFLENLKYKKLVEKTLASAVIVPLTFKNNSSRNLIYHRSPSDAFSIAMDFISPIRNCVIEGINKKAEIEDGSIIEENVSIDAFVVIKKGAKISRNCVLYPFVYIGENVYLGENSIIYPNVSIYNGSIIGKNVIIHSGSVIGGDGFGYTSKNGKNIKIKQRGIVEIGDDVEIGCNVTIDRARIGKTSIGRGTKIDNLVMIAHNVKIGENSLIVAQTGISGSTELGKNVTVAGQAGFAGHIKIGDGSIIGARSGVLKNFGPKSIISGFPAQEHRKELNLLAHYRKLPDIFKRIEALEKKIKENI